MYQNQSKKKLMNIQELKQQEANEYPGIEAT